MMAADVLVTGAAGFVGRALVARLQAEGRTVTPWTRAHGDIAQGTLPAQGAAHVVHLAAKTFVPDSWRSPASFYEANVLGTAHVLEYCRRWQASLTLVSSYVYGVPRFLPVTEEHPVAPFNPYAHSKILAEAVGHAYSQWHGVPCTIIRPFNLYGPGQAGPFLVPTIIGQALDPALPRIRIRDDRPRRDFVFLDDFVDLMVRAITIAPGGVLNAASGVSLSIGELATLIAEASGTGKSIECDRTERPGEIPDTRGSFARANTLLGWQPRHSVAEGIAKTIAAALTLGETELP